MKCQDVQIQVSAYLLNDLDASSQPQIKEHLDQCQACSREFHERKLVSQRLRESFGDFPIPRFLLGNVISRGYEKIQLEQQRRKRHTIYEFMTAAAVVLVGLVSYFSLVTSPSHVFDGTLYVETKGERSKVLKSFDSLPVGQTLKTSERQSAKIKLRDGSVIELAANTTLALKSGSWFNGRSLNLEQGELHCQVAKGGGFRILMPGAELKTLGTEFVVRTSVNKKEITTLQNKLLSFITSATVKVVVSSGKVLLTTGLVQQEIKAGETVIRDVNPPLPVELQTEVKELINQLGNENELIRQEAFARLAKIGYVSVPFLEELLLLADSIQKPYINQLLERFSGPELLWSYEIPDVGFTLHPPVVSEDQLFIVDGSGLYALDRLHGSVNWKLQQDGFNSAPLLKDGIIYIGTLEGNFFAIESKEGKIIWQQTGLGATQSTPTIYDNTIYVGTGEPGTNRGKFYALDAPTGKRKWGVTTNGVIAGSQALVYYNLVFVGTRDHKLYAFHVQTGELVWDYQTGGRIVTASLIDEHNELIYCGSWDGQLYALSIHDGQKQWSFQADSAIIESPIKVGPTIYWGTEHKIYALDLQKCTVSWIYNRERSIIGIINVSKGSVYLGTDGGKVIALDASTGQENWRYDFLDDNKLPTCWYHIAGQPVFFNDVFYIATYSVGNYLTDSRMHALKLK